jgi:hypothetical protein
MGSRATQILLAKEIRVATQEFEDSSGTQTVTPAVRAAGKLSEALEWVERARGRLFDFHQLIGRADFLFEDAADLLEEAGHAELAATVRRDAVGANVLPGRWTFQVIDEFLDGYYAAVTGAEQRVRDELTGGVRHVYEARMKEERRRRYPPPAEGS